MLRDIVWGNTLLQRTLVHARAVRLRRRHPEGLPPPVPRRIIVEPTNACNLACSYCGNRVMKRAKTNLDLQTYEELLDQMVELRIPRLTLHTIGEPTLHPEIARMLAMATERERCVTMSTNGMLLNEELSRGIVRSHPDLINFSVDAADPEVLERTRPGQRLDVLLENIRTLRRIRDEEGEVGESPWGPVRLPTITINCVLTDLFTRVVERRFFEIFTPLADDFLFHRPNNHVSYPLDHPFRQRTLLPGRLRTSIYRAVRMPCPYPWDALFLLSDGTVSVCRFDFEAQVSIGRFPEMSITDLWGSEAMRSLRRAHLDFDYRDWTQCRDCTAAFFENRHEHILLSRKLMRRNGVTPARDAWLTMDPRKTMARPAASCSPAT